MGAVQGRAGSSHPNATWLALLVSTNTTPLRYYWSIIVRSVLVKIDGYAYPSAWVFFGPKISPSAT